MIRIILLSLTGLLLWAGTGRSGPLYDPFLERFQVGTFNDPAEIKLERGFPSDLLDPVQVDAIWMNASRRILSSGISVADTFLTSRLLSQVVVEGLAENWRAGMVRVLDQLESGSLAGSLDSDGDPLLAARASRNVFLHLHAGRRMQAAALAIRLRDLGPEVGLSPREVFVWDLRAKLLFQVAGNRPAGSGTSWPSMLDLGPFDKGNAWAVWMAYCRATDSVPLAAAMTSEEWGRHLAEIGNPRLKPEEIYTSGFSPEFQAGLGAVMFRGAQRDAHFRRFPNPPRDSRMQGLWIRGRRLQSGGDPAVYERMASRGDLRPGWRMDVWRRASELRLLNGEWEQGVADLEKALILAGKGEGHSSTRRRLRQWNEQALVLALADGDKDKAARLRDLGLAHFQGDEKDAFRAETGHWILHLDSDLEDPSPPDTDPVARARALIETGQAPDLGPVQVGRTADFRAVASGHLWDLWIRWGEALANPEPVQGLKRERAITYGKALAAMKDHSDPSVLETAALGIVALRLGSSPVFPRMLDQAFDHDVGRACGWAIAPDPSLVPDLLPELRGSELDRHALLGFALALGDMRGILAVAYELEGRGLTRDEKRLFLYPLPSRGAIFDAIATAESDPALLLAVARNESLFEPSVRSRAGALGWMQIMPFHYEERGALPGKENWRNPAVSIGRGDGLLRENSRRYGGNPYMAVAAYNAGPQAASRWERQLGGEPARDIYLAWIGYPETRRYVEKVLIDREIYDAIIRAEFPE